MSSTLLLQLFPSKQESSSSFPWLQKQTEIRRQENQIPEQIYIHPLDKSSSYYTLSQESLEICTETLGSETGSYFDNSINESYYMVPERKSYRKINQAKITREIRKSSFPPPLSSISDKKGVQVQSYRENGRLIIKAVDFSHRKTNFQAVRENGRLRLTLIKEDLFKDEELEVENVVENVDGPGKDFDESEFNGCYNWGDNLKDGGKIVCKDWPSNRCKGHSKRIQSLPICVAIS